MLGAVFEAPAFISGFDNVAMMGEPVEERGRHLGVAEDARPFTEGQIGRDDHRGAFVELANEMLSRRGRFRRAAARRDLSAYTSLDDGGDGGALFAWLATMAAPRSSAQSSARDRCAPKLPPARFEHGGSRQ